MDNDAVKKANQARRDAERIAENLKEEVQTLYVLADHVCCDIRRVRIIQTHAAVEADAILRAALAIAEKMQDITAAYR